MLKAYSLLSYCILFLTLNKIAYADDIESLAKDSQNPVADLISVPFQNNTNFELEPYNRIQNVLNIQPVIPAHISSQWNIITRIILPVISQPILPQPSGSIFGIGDLNPTFFLSPGKPGKLIWGIGPVFLFPTATKPLLGQGKYSAGPSAVLLTMPGHWVIGVLANNTWSFSGQANRENVNQFYMQYFINYNLPKGWFLTSAPIITADWTAEPDDQWVLPFGAGFGRVFKVGIQPLNVSLSGYYNVCHPTIGPEWQLRTQVSFLFPEKK